MRRHKRVAMVTGFVGALVALALPFAAATPASASPPANLVTITKTVSGVPTQAGNYEVEVSCDDNVAATPTNTQTATIPQAGGSATLSFPGEFVDCDVRETQTRLADSTTIQATSPDLNSVITNATPNDATTAGGLNLLWTGALVGGRSATVFIQNNFFGDNPNKVNVTKAFTGTLPAGVYAEITVNCNAAGVYPVTSNFTAVFTANGTQEVKIPKTDLGPCLVTEPVLSPTTGLQSQTMNQPGGVPGQPLGLGLGSFLPGGGTANNAKGVTVTNRYLDLSTNHIVVTKRVRGDVPLAIPHFVVNVTCSNAVGDPANVPPTDVQNFAFPVAGGTHTFDVSKDYRSCTIAETPNQGPPAGVPGTNYQATISAADGTLNSVGPADVRVTFATGNNHTANVTVTNRFPDPTPSNVIRVRKVVDGTAPAGALFVVQATCSNTGATVHSLLFGNGLPENQEIKIPQGAGSDTCTLRESSSGGAVATTYAGQADSPTSVVTATQNPGGRVDITWPTAAAASANGDEVGVTVTNRFTGPKPPLVANTLVVKKKIRGDGPTPPSFTIRVRCSGAGITDEWNLTFTSQVLQTLSVPATRNSCVVKELNAPADAAVTYEAKSTTADATAGPRSGRIEFGTTGGEAGRVNVINRFPGACAPGVKYC